jgi:hypothetical protein
MDFETISGFEEMQSQKIIVYHLINLIIVQTFSVSSLGDSPRLNSSFLLTAESTEIYAKGAKVLDSSL